MFPQAVLFHRTACAAVKKEPESCRSVGSLMCLLYDGKNSEGERSVGSLMCLLYDGKNSEGAGSRI